MSDVLKPYRVLDLSDERGQLCGQILGDLGADVIQVEPPGGSPTRQRGPFAGDSGDPNDSLSWWALNRNKRSLTLELRAEQDRATLRALARSADFLIESETPGVMDELGLGYDALSELNPALIYASITPFGVEGPKRDYAATDLTTVAASGSMISNGDADRPAGPTRAGTAGISARIGGCSHRHARRTLRASALRSRSAGVGICADLRGPGLTVHGSLRGLEHRTTRSCCRRHARPAAL